MSPTPNRVSIRVAVEKRPSHCQSRSGTDSVWHHRKRRVRPAYKQAELHYPRAVAGNVSDFGIGPGPTRCGRSGVIQGIVPPSGPSDGCRDRWPVRYLSQTKEVWWRTVYEDASPVGRWPPMGVGSAIPDHRGRVLPRRAMPPRLPPSAVHISAILRRSFSLQASLTVLAFPCFVAPDPVPGLGLALRIVRQECDGRSIQCMAGRRIVAHGPLQFGGCHCQVARFPAALGFPTGEHVQRNGHASMCHSLQPRSTYRLGFPGDGRRLQGLVDLPRHAVTRLTQSVHLRVFHVVHFPVRAVDCHRHSNPPHRSASVAEVPGAGGESVSAATSHNRTVPSRLPLARVRPSGLKATLVTQSA